MKAFRRAGPSAGFTLMELMIAVAIVGVLSAIALPIYKGSLRNSQKANAESVLVNCAQQMERFYAQSMSYASAPACSAATAANIASSYAIGSGGAPVATATTYYFLAVPTADQLPNSCKTLCIDNTGAKLAGTASGAGSSCASLIPSPLAGCW